MGQGVLKAVNIIDQIIGPALIGKEPSVIRMDELLRDLDGTENKSNLGANTLLAVSIAVCKAQALVEEVHVYEVIAYLCGYDLVSLPYPMLNVINGGLHASNNLRIQEFMIMPVGLSTFHGAMEAGVMLFQTLKQILHQHGFSTAVGDEGGFAPDLDYDTQALDFIMEAIDTIQHNFEGTIMLALDVAASQFYNPQTGMYNWHGKMMTSDQMIEWYIQLVEKYPLYALEDGLSEQDIEGWQKLTTALGSKIQIVGDDIFVSNSQRIYDGIEENIANTVVIKPNQVGTVTECLQSIKLCKEYNRSVIISHRSGETNDTFIADVAVGTSAGQIKTGGLSRGERLAKYNALLEIEDELLNR